MRTDRQLQEDVLAALAWEPGVRAEHIGVAVADGVVTLHGLVSTLRERYLAEHTTRDVRGVRSIANEIRVAPDGGDTKTDAELAAAVANALEWDSALSGASVKAVVRSGWVTISGSVGWAYQRNAAERAVRNLTGVIGVTNEVSISTAADTSAVKAGIEEAFRRSAHVDAEHVVIEARGGTVVLKGTVHSLAELDAAERAAWAAPGVTEVDDHLVVVP